MYQAHFGLDDMPFRIGSDPRFHVDLAPQRAAVRALLDGSRGGHDFTSLCGDFGCGKSTVARRMLREADPARHTVGELRLTRLEGDGLFDGVTLALGMPATHALPPLGSLLQRLEALARDGRRALLVVDEAHRLGLDALTRLRKLAAVRVQGRAALHVVLVGHAAPAGIAELQRLGRPLNIGPPVRLRPLDGVATRDYILGRLRRAGWTGRPAFDAGTTAEVHARCEGNPARINRLCGHLLLQLFMERRTDADAATVRAVDDLLRRELSGEPATITLPRASPAHR